MAKCLPLAPNLANAMFNITHMPVITVCTQEMNSMEEACSFVKDALEVGYRCFEFYDNNSNVALALIESLPYFNLLRENIFIILKFELNASTEPEFVYDISIVRLSSYLDGSGIDYADLLILHAESENYELQVAIWDAMEELLKTNMAYTFGAYNVPLHYLIHFLSESTVHPVMIQIQFNPLHQQWILVDICQDSNIMVQAYNLFGQDPSNELLQNPTVNAIATEHNATPAQVLLVWMLQSGIGVQIKSNTFAELEEYFELDFRLTDQNLNDLINLVESNEGLDFLIN